MPCKKMSILAGFLEMFLFCTGGGRHKKSLPKQALWDRRFYMNRPGRNSVICGMKVISSSATTMHR